LIRCATEKSKRRSPWLRRFFFEVIIGIQKAVYELKIILNRQPRRLSGD
jgi:hypothetical protein